MELEATTQFLNLYFMFRFGEWPHVCMLLGKIYTLVVPLIEIYTLVVPLIEIYTLVVPLIEICTLVVPLIEICTLVVPLIEIYTLVVIEILSIFKDESEAKANL